MMKSSTNQIEESVSRLVTPKSGIEQQLGPRQLINWMSRMGSTPTIMQTAAMIESLPSVTRATIIPQEASIPPELGITTVACKLTYSVEPARSMAEIVKENLMKDQGMQLKFYPPVIKDGIKLVQLNLDEMEQQCQQWKNALIEYVIGERPAFKEMLKFVWSMELSKYAKGISSGMDRRRMSTEH
uniref:Uncharacterized protein n=2 Tax=Nicotiana TaxID=4085 RepID=A0A1S3YTP5_TOBAC|nr:PREDICTED: uncharacterized protein LOC104234112 [Nicotiana sylvestris]XP_009785915.1 PREDICTED: uncharacterized protein LOC104234112 [Nicotiana sylvestris]XP_016455578.1 PREDICTED: uncharacterized protein LOC107779636 [Nicotiana tabacum]XP_016455579.1 PREDICTED: uncharacterized protein LOC107779636 [Nicotiana tabacum]